MSNLTNLAEATITSGEVEVIRQQQSDLELLRKIVDIWDAKSVSESLRQVSPHEWSRESISKYIKGTAPMPLFNTVEQKLINSLLPKRPDHYDNPSFTFIDLFAGIGGIRAGFEKCGGRCLFTSEWNKYAQKTYNANWYAGEGHKFVGDIREVTLSTVGVSEKEAYQNIDKTIPDHDVLLAGFPCQPFSLAGVSKKNALGRAHGFECDAQGTLFFDVARILKAKQPRFFVLENVKNLKSHDKGKTFKIILDTLDELGYDIADRDVSSTKEKDPKVIDAKNFLPQHRERIVLVGFRKDEKIENFTLKKIEDYFESSIPSIGQLLENEVDQKYTLTPKLWEYLYNYAKKHKAKGNGFGYGLINPFVPEAIARTLSARYHKDGSEILINDKGWDSKIAESDFWDIENQLKRPRRLTPRECARLMGFDAPKEESFKIPVSDTQAYKQFGNSVVVPVFHSVAKLLKPYI
jgi:DNA (cytosine-5)-methyltransferase 1